jgi:hypothetical protein
VASTFRETYRALSRLLHEQARAIGVFDHPTAKGDGREDLLRTFLAERVGTTFGVTKAEVVDSNGLSSGELDAVIYDQSVTSCLNVVGERRIVRAEAVVATIEVKSAFSPSTWPEEQKRVEEGIGRLTRFYRPLPFLSMMQPDLRPEVEKKTEEVFKSGLSTLDDHYWIPAVVSAYFGYGGPDEDSQELTSFIEAPLLDVVCVLGKYTIAKERVGFNKRANDAHGYLWGRGDDALGAFMQVLENALGRTHDSRVYVHPLARYYGGEHLQREAAALRAIAPGPASANAAATSTETTTAGQ